MTKYHFYDEYDHEVITYDEHDPDEVVAFMTNMILTKSSLL